MTQGSMSLARFASILDAYGAAPRRWPAAERAAAEALLAESPEARAMLEKAAELDRLLDAAEPPAPSATLRAKILEAAPGRVVRSRARWRRVPASPAARRFAAAAALAASLVLGMVTGGTLLGDPPAEGEGEFLQLALFDDDLAGY
jgi:hypothetical protein